MDKTQSDLVEWYELETEFFQDYVRHTKYVGKAKNRNEKVTENWSNCGELGRGGFGVVHKQIQETTGHCRAVKTIDKRPCPKADYSRELLVMAILAKRPSLFVEFLGWFEEPETLYIAMEYLEQGDLAKHIGTPLPQETVQNISRQILEGLNVMHQHGIAHRDLKPANIFVVSMSPVWVKLGDFGVSKRILAQTTTTLHTQVSTQIYSAPEVLGLDPNSETSEYTNSVDIWSLGCVIYELLLGTKLFGSDFDLYRYFYGIWPLPEDRLRGLSPPTDDTGISLLNAMLAIQPEDRPTAADALRHAWLADVKTDNGPSGGLQNGDDLTTPKSKAVIGTTVMIPSDAASAERSAIHTGHQKSKPMLHDSQALHFKGPNVLEGKPSCDISQTSSRGSTPNTKLNPHTKHISNENWVLNPLQAIPQRPIPAIDPVSDRASIHCKILTPSETLIMVGILIGVLMLAGILTRTLGLAATLAGILMLAKILSRIPTLSGTCTETLMPASTLISEEIEASDGAPIPDGTQAVVAEHRLDRRYYSRGGRGGYREN